MLNCYEQKETVIILVLGGGQNLNLNLNHSSFRRKGNLIEREKNEEQVCSFSGNEAW